MTVLAESSLAYSEDYQFLTEAPDATVTDIAEYTEARERELTEKVRNVELSIAGIEWARDQIKTKRLEQELGRLLVGTVGLKEGTRIDVDRSEGYNVGRGMLAVVAVEDSAGETDFVRVPQPFNDTESAENKRVRSLVSPVTVIWLGKKACLHDVQGDKLPEDLYISRKEVATLGSLGFSSWMIESIEASRKASLA